MPSRTCSLCGGSRFVVVGVGIDRHLQCEQCAEPLLSAYELATLRRGN
jgi:hypothetical protein